jgi:hypothetical protein
VDTTSQLLPAAETERAMKVQEVILKAMAGSLKWQYFDFNVRHFHEKLVEEHNIRLSDTWVKKALQEAGLVAKQKRRGTHRRRRPRRPMPGMLLHVDGSRHMWFQDGRDYDLIPILDGCHERDLLRAAGAGRGHADGDARGARGR